jgi:hypothetical protein
MRRMRLYSHKLIRTAFCAGWIFQLYSAKLMHLIFNVVCANVHLVENNLTHTVQVTLVMHFLLKVFRLILCPIQEKCMEGSFTLIQAEKEFTVIDNINGFYA